MLPWAQTLWFLLGSRQRLPACAHQQSSPAWRASSRLHEKHVTPGRVGEQPSNICSLAPIHQCCPGLEWQSRRHRYTHILHSRGQKISSLPRAAFTLPRINTSLGPTFPMQGPSPISDVFCHYFPLNHLHNSPSHQHGF